MYQSHLSFNFTANGTMTIATNLCKGVIKHCGFKQSSRGLAVQSNRWTNCTNMENYNADQVCYFKELLKQLISGRTQFCHA